MFETHKLNEKGQVDLNVFKGGMNASITKALSFLPDGRDKSIFITKIEEAMFFATRAIASKEGNYSEVVKNE